MRRLFGEELSDVGECFELESIACGIEEEHGCLFADLAFEADIGLDDEGDACAAKAVGEGFPVFHGQHDAEVRDGDIVAVDGVVVGFPVGGGGLEMRDDLMAEEIEVDPLRGAASFRAAEDGSVEGAGCIEVVDGEGDVKWGQAHWGLLDSIIRWPGVRGWRAAMRRREEEC